MEPHSPEVKRARQIHPGLNLWLGRAHDGSDA